MPSHISLGVGLQVLNIVEKEAIKLDDTVREAEGQPNENISTLMDELTKLGDIYSEQIEKLNLMKAKRDESSSYLSEFTKERANFLEKNGRKYVDVTPAGCNIKANHRKLKLEHDKAVKQLKQIEKDTEMLSKHVDEKKRELEGKKGHFQSKFCEVIDNINLHRQAYHSHALVGNDVHKFTKTKNIKQLADVFKPTVIRQADNKSSMFSSERLRNKIKTLLWKFIDYYKMYSIKRPLCKHEVALLTVRCASLGSWMPGSFPDESIIRKFHVLTYHIPQKARKRKSVGIEAEHYSEAIHPVINELDRKYHCVQIKGKTGMYCKVIMVKI